MNSPAPQLRSRLPRLAEAAVERARLTVVPTRRRPRAPRVPFVTLVSLILLGGVVGLLLFNTSMQQASFAATALEEQATNLSAREQTLQMELERLRDPQRVAEAAKAQGLVIPSAPAFLDLETGEVTGHVAPATAAGDTVIKAPPPTRPDELDPDPVRLQPTSTGGDRRSGVGDRAGRDGEPRLSGQDRDRHSDDRTDHRQNDPRRR
jgi:cell division protein FtsB